ncbi:MAG: DUF4869 domain-containing protein [Oscillospiraceae bacterium]|jgi:hypothetical protein|nr:DUF4869 domain-containing protein [Oscillospiraceae bacterium]
MLKITFDGSIDYIRSGSQGFDGMYTSEWLTNPISRQIIKDIDNAEVLGNGAVQHPFLGVISPEKLAGGIKILLAANMLPEEECKFGSDVMGDNCLPWLLKISEKKDILLLINHCLQMPEDMHTPVLFTNNGKIVDNEYDFTGEMLYGWLNLLHPDR